MFFGEFLCLVAFFLLYAFQRYRWNQANIQGSGENIRFSKRFKFHSSIVKISNFIQKLKIMQFENCTFLGQHGAIVEISSDSEPVLPRFNYLVFLPPACCDILATSIMYIGLNLTTASSFQMLRGKKFQQKY